jgi:isopentenyl-diphosphate delta-isomerase
MSPGHLTSERKQEHLDLCRTQDVSSQQDAGWDAVRIPHCALPELSMNDVDTRATFLGHTFAAPFLISSMTGGSAEGEKINATLAEFAQTRNIPMGVGSQRVALENRDSGFFALRKIAPKATLFANLGIVQLNRGVSVKDCQWLIDQLEAAALILHVNPLQEAIQTEGDRDFSNLFSQLTKLRKQLKVPIILKETGCGLDPQTCVRAIECGVDALDIAGMGGTHWGFIEGLRDPQRHELGEMFRNWGWPTAEILPKIRSLIGPSVPLIASGGIRHGLDLAKALYLGADLGGMALPFLKAAQGGLPSLNAFLNLHLEAYRIALFCSGARHARVWRE